MKTYGKASLSALFSLIGGLIATFIFVGYGITDEVPVGSLSGQVTMQENGRPLPKAFVTMTKLFPDDLYQDEDIATEHHFMADKSGRFQLHDILSGRYKLEVSTSAHKYKGLVDVVEGKTTSLPIEAAPIDPYLELYASQRVYLPQETPKVQVHGFSHEASLKATIYKLDFDKVIKDGGLNAALAPLARPSNDKVKDPATMGSVAKVLDVPLADRDAEGTFRFHLPLTAMPEGLYWIQCVAGNISRGTWLSVTKIALITKSSRNDLAAYVTKLDTGEPVPGATVGFSTPTGIVASATTSSSGLVRLNLPNKSSGDAEVVVASAGDSRAIVDFQRAEADEEDDEGGGLYSETRIYCYTDRPIYRPGDLIQYKGIVRHLNNATYVLPKKKEVEVDFTDGSGDVLASQNLAVSEMGTYHGQFQMSPDSLPDDYNIVTHYGSVVDNKSVGVAAYRKPTFSITVSPEKKVYIRGEQAKMDVDAKYYYGAPVVGATVTATVTRTQYWAGEDASGDDEDNGGDESAEQTYPGATINSEEGGEQTQQVTATTDGNGKAVIVFPTVGANESEEAAADYDYTVSVSVKDPSDKEFTGEGDVHVLRSDESMQLSSDPMVVMAGDAFNSIATLKTLDGRPLAGTSVRFTSGFVTYSKTGVELLVDKQFGSATTDASGVATQRIQPQGRGYYEIRAEFTDDRGHPVSETSGVYLFASAPFGGEEGYEPQVDLSVILDKKHYNVGDTAKAVITCKDPGGTALLAIEGTMIHMAQTVKLTSRSTLVKIKVVNDYSPNVFVSVAYIRNKQYSSVQKQMVIDLGIKKLSVSVASDKASYHPGDKATYTVTTKDAKGVPVPAELSLGVVDESIYSIFDDQSDIVKAFYPKRGDDVATNYSFPELYLGGGDKAPTNIQVRRKFVDTAYWGPTVETDKSGQARVTVALPDNLTSWRATVRAVTADTQVGQTTENVVARKDLMIQLSAPAYVVKGDEQRMVAMVTNNTSADADVKVNLQATNAKVQGDLNTTVHIASGAMQTIEYKIDTVDTGEADFVAKAWIPSGPSDGMELKVPVRPHARLVTDGYGGLTSSSKEIDFNIQPGADPNSGDLEIGVAPTIASSLVESINALVDFPYGCVEQTTSRFLPTVVLAKAYADIGLPKPKLSKEIPAIVQDSFQRLQAMQHADGGWGWWEYDESEPHMTAYVLEAIYRAKQAGFEAPKSINLSKALEWSANFLEKGRLPSYITKPTEEDLNRHFSEKTYLAYAMMVNGEKQKSKAFLDRQNLLHMDAAQSAFTALAYDQLGEMGLAKRNQAIRRMLFLAKETKSTLSWKEEDWWGYETTGRCFQALETIQPDSPLIAKIVTELMQVRRGALWYSTRDTAAIMLAMADYLRHTKELLSPAQFTVLVNGRAVSDVQFAQGAFPDKPTSIKLHITELKLGQNKIEFQAKSGVCYYTATLKQYVAADDLAALPEGTQLSVSREYYKLEARRLEDGTMKLLPSKQPITDYKSGDVIQCVLKIHADADRDYVFVEDPTPSGLHVTDRETPDEGENWAYWWSRTVILDDRVCLFASHVNGGDSAMSYVLQAENPGTCSALPTTIYNMYDASDTASSGAIALEVTP